MTRPLMWRIATAALSAALLLLPALARAADAVRVPILVYHRFGPTVADEMTVTTQVFESQLRIIHDRGYTVIPLADLVAYIQGKGAPPPTRSVVITVDDAHRSVYTEMLPLIRRHRYPVTLFVYPSAVSNASYAMTWAQLHELQQSGLFTIQAHTYWHPNFKVEKRRLSPAEYQRFVERQFEQPRAVIEKKLGVTPDMMAWPFGIHDEELMEMARRDGYVAAFTIERRPASKKDNLMDLPRYLMTDTARGRSFERLLAGE
jgi:peptidoglycan/xylan/chitin deacetylase (PgdA/CDA1 family)